MRRPTRTDLVEDFQRHTEAMRVKALDLVTAARHYGSLADTIDALPSEGGDLFIEARKDIASTAHERRRKCLAQAEALRTEADTRDRNGYRGDGE